MPRKLPNVRREKKSVPRIHKAVAGSGRSIIRKLLSWENLRAVKAAVRLIAPGVLNDLVRVIVLEVWKAFW